MTKLLIYTVLLSIQADGLEREILSDATIALNLLESELHAFLKLHKLPDQLDELVTFRVALFPYRFRVIEINAFQQVSKLIFFYSAIAFLIPRQRILNMRYLHLHFFDYCLEHSLQEKVARLDSLIPRDVSNLHLGSK